MCSIIGYSGGLIPLEELKKGFDETVSRGPDMTRLHPLKQGMLGFHRLAIMGLTETGMQPFVSGGIACVCNGEIYGFRSIRCELEEKGYTFRSDSDCEILIPLYLEYGVSMFSMLDTEFAMILYDESCGLIAARDPIGIRPLYYGYDREGSIIFASEAKNLVGLTDRIMPFPPGHYYINSEFHCYRDITRVDMVNRDDITSICRNIREKLTEGITGENLNVLIGSEPIEDKEVEQRVKLNVLGLLHEAYGITEADFARAEVEVVPAFKARDIGFDRAMVGAYGHDDRVDAYPALMAEIETKSPAYTTVCVLTDKEETGSDGVTGLQSMYTFHFLQQLCKTQGADAIKAFQASKCLSADVTAAYDPGFADAFEPDNGTYAGRGVAIYKYTGARGKSGTSDASAEMVSYLTRLMDQNGVSWQIGEMGKIDLGGGGTVAKYVANQDIDTIDIGVPVLAMHSPFEVVSKVDVYMAYRTFKAFCEDAE